MTEETTRALFKAQIEEISSRLGIPKHEAFPRWICENVLGIVGEARIDEAVSVGGKSDYGVDVFHMVDAGDITEQYVCWAQAKFSEDLDHVVTREEMESFSNTLRYLRNCPEKANLTFKQKSREMVNIETMNPRIRKRMIFAVTGRLGEQVKDLIRNDGWSEILGMTASSNTILEIRDLDDILSRITAPHTPSITLEFVGGIITKKDITTGKDSIRGHVRADHLIKLVKAHKETLFLENPRETLGKTAPTHKAMYNTLSNPVKKHRFWKMNNGITATCSRLEAGKDANTYVADNLKIVNGRQTIYTLENHPDVSDVHLLMSVHQEVDDDERNEISESTNTQNPVKPADLVSNYPEMVEMVLQCRMNFRDFYFQRQTNGFKSAKKSVRARVTLRRVLEKSDTARAYYAYEMDPNVTKMLDKVLFSTTSYPNYYERIFKDRNVRDLIIPHIFMSMLGALHRKWCKETDDAVDPAMVRNKGMLGKDLVKYFILHFISKSMNEMEEHDRESVKDAMISRFRVLKEYESLPDDFLAVAEAAFKEFFTIFDVIKHDTWPAEVLNKIKDSKEIQVEDKPAPLDVMYTLRTKGDTLLPSLLMTRTNVSGEIGDRVGKRLLALVPNKD